MHIANKFAHLLEPWLNPVLSDARSLREEESVVLWAGEWMTERDLGISENREAV